MASSHSRKLRTLRNKARPLPQITVEHVGERIASRYPQSSGSVKAQPDLCSLHSSARLIGPRDPMTHLHVARRLPPHRFPRPRNCDTLPQTPMLWLLRHDNAVEPRTSSHSRGQLWIHDARSRAGNSGVIFGYLPAQSRSYGVGYRAFSGSVGLA